MRYEPGKIEARWQAWWAADGTYRTPGPGDSGFDVADPKPKYYVIDMFPYPSGKGLHVGHPLGYIATDIVARYKRMRGFNVLHPMGFDAFGLPAEQFAVEHNVHPWVTTEQNIATMRRQLGRLGLGYDWSREIRTCDPEYYRWTQWIFLQLYGSWFDPRAGDAGAARPIGELEAALASGELAVEEGGVAEGSGSGDDVPLAWSSLSAEERRAVIDGQRLAYLAEVPVNWCPGLGTVLANEEVTAEGRSERGNFLVYRRPLEQWMLRITAYADRLIDELATVDWPDAIKTMQLNWIGRSEGARVSFPIAGPRAEGDSSADVIEVFTTRPDTLFGATYVVLAPEHPLVEVLTTREHLAAVRDYVRAAAAKSEVERQAEGRAKTGVVTGGHAVNPGTGQPVPIWIADYVLAGYGTGAIMGVPAHDHRDFEFASAHGLQVRGVVMPPDEWLVEVAGGDRELYARDAGAFPAAYVGDGIAINSAGREVDIDGMKTEEAKAAVAAWLESSGNGRREVRYKLRDWLFSRQRYWGEPFPMLRDPEGRPVPVAEADLPVELPPMEDFKPRASDDPDATPQPPLARAPREWRVVEVDGREHTRELNTMPNWAGSCWYYLRYLDPRNSERMVDPAAERYWMGERGVDLYVGGVEHAVLHLLYARFWHKVLFDLGHVSTPEPFGKLFNQGYIQAFAYTDERGAYVPADEVEEHDGRYTYHGKEVRREYGKMGKSLKNIVTPDDVVEAHGCDALRLYEMFMGPLDQSKPWNPRDIVGIDRFLARAWRNLVDEDSGDSLVIDAPPGAQLERLLHITIQRVTDDFEGLRFNTAVAALIELNNALVALEAVPRVVAESFVVMLAPLAPHIAEELWTRMGNEPSVMRVAWPTLDESKLATDEVEVVLQVNGKVRGRVTVPAGADREAVERAALSDANVLRHIEGAEIRKVIVVPGKLINIVAG